MIEEPTLTMLEEVQAHELRRLREAIRRHRDTPGSINAQRDVDLYRETLGTEAVQVKLTMKRRDS